MNTRRGKWRKGRAHFLTPSVSSVFSFPPGYCWQCFVIKMANFVTDSVYYLFSFVRFFTFVPRVGRGRGHRLLDEVFIRMSLQKYRQQRAVRNFLLNWEGWVGYYFSDGIIVRLKVDGKVPSSFRTVRISWLMYWCPNLRSNCKLGWNRISNTNKAIIFSFLLISFI